MRIFYAFALVVSLAACTSGGPVEVGGIRVDAALRASAKTQNFDYTGNLDKALKGDDLALGELLHFQTGQDSATTAAHGFVLKSLLEKMGDELFAQKLEKLETDAKQRIWAAVEMAGGAPLQNNSPQTLKTLMPPAKVEEATGLYIFASQNSRFRDCAEPDANYFVVDETGGSLEKKYRSLIKYPYPDQAAVAKLKGYKAAYHANLTLPNGFAGFFVVNEMLEMEQKNFRNTCIPYEFWAVGTEPFWQAEISAAEGVIEYRGMDDEQTKVFAYQSPTIEDSVKIYTGVNQDSGDNIRIEVSKKPCSDGMSDRNYRLQVKLNVNGKEMNGCGIPYELGQEAPEAAGN